MEPKEIGAPMSMHRVTALLLSWIVFSTANSVSVTAQQSCASECGKPGSPYCLALQDSSTTVPVGLGLRDLHSAVLALKPGGTLATTRLMSMFKLSGDPCQRSNTTYSNGVLLNSGKSHCSIISSVSLPSGSKLEAGFVVREKVTGKLSVAGNVATLNFRDERFGEVPILLIKDLLLQPDWGGYVKQIDFSPDQVLIETEAGCLLYKF